jgi:hypothetical protein
LWYTSSLSVTCGEDNAEVVWRNSAPGEWYFFMPESDVAVSALFTDTPIASDKLSFLDVSRGSFSSAFASDTYDYHVDIPHIFEESPEAPVFFIHAKAEDPNAGITITSQSAGDADLYGAELALAEGVTVYTVTVTPAEGGPAQDYTLTVNYEPDITLGSVTLTTPIPGGENWKRTLDPARLSNVIVPCQKVAVTAYPNDESGSPAVAITKIGSTGVFSSSNNTAEFNAASVTITLRITVSRQVNGGAYSKDYAMSLIGSNVAVYPTELLAEGGSVSVVLKDNVYYELHTFAYNEGQTETLVMKDGEVPPTARVLVVAGGGGGGQVGGGDDSGGGGSGGVGYAAAVLLEGTTEIIVGAGGGVNENGGGSVFGNVTVNGGGAGGSGSKGGTGSYGQPGGSGGGGGGGAYDAIGYGAAAIAHDPVDGYIFLGGKGADGDAGANGGNGGNASYTSDISGSSVVYAVGGAVLTGANGANGANGTGNGGGGGKHGTSSVNGGTGGSGIVIVRFPPKISMTPKKTPRRHGCPGNLAAAVFGKLIANGIVVAFW